MVYCVRLAQRRTGRDGTENRVMCLPFRLYPIFQACIVVHQLQLVSGSCPRWLDRIFLRRSLAQIALWARICQHHRFPIRQFYTRAFSIVNFHWSFNFQLNLAAATGCDAQLDTLNAIKRITLAVMMLQFSSVQLFYVTITFILHQSKLKSVTKMTSKWQWIKM